VIEQPKVDIRVILQLKVTKCKNPKNARDPSSFLACAEVIAG
jgi:hypothetical protein